MKKVCPVRNCDVCDAPIHPEMEGCRFTINNGYCPDHSRLVRREPQIASGHKDPVNSRSFPTTAYNGGQTMAAIFSKKSSSHGNYSPSMMRYQKPPFDPQEIRHQQRGRKYPTPHGGATTTRGREG